MLTMTKKPAMFRLEAETIDALDELALDLGVAKAAIVRAALDAAIAKIRAARESGATPYEALGLLQRLGSDED